ncbi:hypothetical protein ACN47E_001797 [Coniothyrium glycines]
MASEDTLMANAPPTPGDEQQLTSPAVDFSPATVPYDEAFENSLMEAILNPPSATSPKQPSADPPMIPASQLPVPLTSPHRTHPSPIPGVLVTHKHGYHTGGPGPSPHTINEFAQSFIAERGIQDAKQLEAAVQRIVKEKMEEVKERMEKRKAAVEKNRGVERELDDLKLQRDAELRVLERMKGKR